MRSEEMHVAQQIRRDKLRIQNNSQQQHYFHNNNNNIEHLLSLHQTQPTFNNMVDHDSDAAVVVTAAASGLYSSNNQIINYNFNSNPLHRNTLEEQEYSCHHQLHEAEPSNRLMNYNYYANETFLSSEMSSLINHSSNWGGVNSNNVENVFFSNNDFNNVQQGLSLSLSSSQSNKPSSSTMKQVHQEPPPTSARNVGGGPLGPFTGYATILKSSRFLKPCHEVLQEYCSCFVKSCDVPPKWVSRDETTAKGGTSSSSIVLYGSKENNDGERGVVGNNFCLSSRPACQKNKAQLLFMQQEVTRRYKQYHEQMQMVVSSFEYVAGLSSATPYISMALKSLSKHFKSLKNSITEQLKLTCEVLGEDFSILPTTTSSKIDSNNMTRLRCMNMNNSLQRNKSGGNNSNVEFVEPQQTPVWRPQRGLPERAVAILKAWLFEHFLHPYPTDTDKHMLATQTGLSRNQVSNWFINARVRVWKPMVEEIHMLESKGTTEGEYQNNNNSKNVTHEKQFHHLEKGSSSSGISNVEKIISNEEQWNNMIQEKRSKLENEITPNNMDTTVMGFMPYQSGSVSLTLGLRHGVDSVQHQQQQLQQEVEIRHQFGAHMIHDFVG